jgi:hypothetical protein
MGTGYTRVDVGSVNIADGNVITAADINNEVNGIDAAFNATTGHEHDGTTGNGKPITKVGPAQDLVISGSSVLPKTDNTLDLGSGSFEFKDLYIDGTAYLDAVDIDSGNIDGTAIGASSASTGAFTTLSSSSTTTLHGTTIPASKTLVTTDDTQTLTNKTLTTPIISSISNTGTLTLPTATDTLVGRATTDTLTNKTINLTNNTFVATSLQLAAAVTDETGTGALVFAGSPALTGTPTAPTAVAGTNTTQLATTAHVFAERTNTATLTNKTINGASNTITNVSLTTGVTGVLPAANGGTGVNNSTRTLTVSSNSGTLNFTAASKTLGISNSLTLAGTDATTMTFPSTSATIARTDAAQTFTGAQTFSDTVTATKLIPTGNVTAGNGMYLPTTNTLAFSTNGSEIRVFVGLQHPLWCLTQVQQSVCVSPLLVMLGLVRLRLLLGRLLSQTMLVMPLTFFLTQTLEQPSLLLGFQG